MAFGVALSVRAQLGVSPISCVPYVYSQRFPLTMGQTTIVFNVLLIALQIAVLGKAYRPFQLIQFPVVLVFGIFTDLTLGLVGGLHFDNYLGRMALCLGSCIIIGFGVFLEVKAKLTYLAGEGLALALSERFRCEFGKAKIVTDCSMVLLGVLSSLLLLNRLVGLREGTIIAAVFVGYLARFFSRRITLFDNLASDTKPKGEAIKGQDQDAPRQIVTISREFGSGGREIGRLLAERLKLAFYDKELIRLTAEKSGFTPDYIKTHEQRLANSLLFSLYEQSFSYVGEKMPPLDALFLVQSKIIREIAEKEPCVIVGRCANFVLKDSPNCLNVFIHAGKEFRRNRYMQETGCSPEAAEKELERINHDRDNYCRHFTGRERGGPRFYDLSIDSSKFGIEASVELIIEALRAQNSKALAGRLDQQKPADTTNR